MTNPGPKGATVKLILQGMQVLGTLLPPVAAPAAERRGRAAAPPGSRHRPQRAAGDRDPVGHAQQAEVIRYAQLQANPLLTLSLVLRSPDDFIDPATGQPVPPVIAETTGITLKELIDKYGVLPPVIEAAGPAARSARSESAGIATGQPSITAT